MYTLEHKYFKAEPKAEYVYVQQVEYVYICIRRHFDEGGWGFREPTCETNAHREINIPVTLR